MNDFVHKVKRPDRWEQPYGATVSDEDVLEIYKHKPFSLVGTDNFPANRPFELIVRNDGRIRHLKEGEIITLQGDASNSCFLLLSGDLRIILLENESEHSLQKRTEKSKFWPSLKQLWNNHNIQEYRNPQSYNFQKNSIIDDQGFAVRMIDNPEKIISTSKTAIIKSGQFFGEVAALSRTTRSATIFAETDVLVFELRWQGLRDIRLWDHPFRKWVDKLFHQRSFLPLFTKNPLLRSLHEISLEKVAKSSKFQTYGDQSWYKSTGKINPDTIDQNPSGKVLIVAEGQHMDGLILVRGGFIQITRSYGQGEQTVGYLISNELYGLTSIIDHDNQPDTGIHSRYNLYALGYVDLLVIPTDTVLRYLMPHWKSTKVFENNELMLQSVPMFHEHKQKQKDKLPQELLEILFEQKIINGSATMVIDNNACVGCDECVKACATAHDNNPRFIRHGSNYSHFTFANACMHCIDPVCLSDCPTGAIHRPSELSIVQINDSQCIGCSNCANSCPYDNIRMVEIKNEKDQPLIDENTQKPLMKATKCDLCSVQITGPACQAACSYGALKRLNFSDRKEVRQWFSERY